MSTAPLSDPAAGAAAPGGAQAPGQPPVTPETSDRSAGNIVLPSDVVAALDDPDYDPDLEFVKELAEDTWLVQRRDDPSTQYLGTDDKMDQAQPLLLDLFQRGALGPFSALLNHPNLISYNGSVPLNPFDTVKRRDDQSGATRPRGRVLTLWDYCDAGSLRGFMDRTLVKQVVRPDHILDDAPNMVAKWLPESLCWHVATSVLRALAWLHEGHRQEDTIEARGDGSVVRGSKVQTRLDREEEWLSVLHRGVTTHNIYFQHPKATETYGLCKLGNYSKVYVSGHVNGYSRGKVVCSESGTAPLIQMIDTLNHPDFQDIYQIQKVNRPYYKGTELFHLGEVLYMMMTRRAIPNKEECTNCGIRHWEEGTAQPCDAWPIPRPFQLDEVLEGLQGGYSTELVTVLERLLSHHRDPDVDTADEFRAVRSYYLQWKDGTREGRRYRDYWDDMVTRSENTKRTLAADADQARAQSGPGAVDYVQVAIQWAAARTRAANEAAAAAPAPGTTGTQPTGTQPAGIQPTGATPTGTTPTGPQINVIPPPATGTTTTGSLPPVDPGLASTWSG